MEAIVSAFIGGAFTLIGVYWGHQLAKRRDGRQEEKNSNKNQNDDKINDLKPLLIDEKKPTTRPIKDIILGLLILLGVAVFGASQNPDNLYNNGIDFTAFLVSLPIIFVMPVYALFRIFRGAVRLFI